MPVLFFALLCHDAVLGLLAIYVPHLHTIEVPVLLVCSVFGDCDLIKVGSSRTLLDTVGHCWTLLDTVEHCWTLLDAVGHCPPQRNPSFNKSTCSRFMPCWNERYTTA
jgi:hypothetical protein